MWAPSRAAEAETGRLGERMLCYRRQRRRSGRGWMVSSGSRADESSTRSVTLCHSSRPYLIAGTAQGSSSPTTSGPDLAKVSHSTCRGACPLGVELGAVAATTFTDPRFSFGTSSKNGCDCRARVAVSGVCGREQAQTKVTRGPQDPQGPDGPGEGSMDETKTATSQLHPGNSRYSRCLGVKTRHPWAAR